MFAVVQWPLSKRPPGRPRTQHESRTVVSSDISYAMVNFSVMFLDITYGHPSDIGYPYTH